MSSYLYTGTSGFGKSYHVKNHVITRFKKVVVFDPTESFDGDAVLCNPSDLLINKTFHRFKNLAEFKIVIRTDRRSNDKALFIKTVALATALGRMIPRKVEESDRVQVVVDESSTTGIMSANYFPEFVENLVCKGRHDNLDSHWIAQNPMGVHIQLREMVSKVVTFFLNSGRAPVFQESFTPKLAELIPKLPKYWRMEWTRGEGTSFFDQNSRKIEMNSPEFAKIFLKNDQDFFTLKRVPIENQSKTTKKRGRS